MKYLKDILLNNLSEEEEKKIQKEAKNFIQKILKTNNMKIVPLGKRVLLKEKEAPKYFKGTSIIIPSSEREKEYLATVIAVGSRVEDLKEGDLIKYAKHIQPTAIDHDGEPHILLNEQDIIAIIKDV